MTGVAVNDIDREAIPVLEPAPDPLRPSEYVAWAGITAAVPQVLYPVLTAFGIWEPSVPQWSAVCGLWAFLTGVLTMAARGHVYAPETVIRLLEDARAKARQEASPPRVG